MKKSIRKMLALAVALVMILMCAAASADTVYIKMNMDGNTMKALLPASTVPEQALDAVVKLVSALGIKVVTVPDGVEIGLDLNGKEAVTAGIGATEDGLTVVSTLIPNYVLTVKQETLEQLMKQAMEQVPGLQAMMSGDLPEIPESLMTYIQNFVMAVSGAIVPGEAEQGTYEFEGYTFDTKVPVTVDMPAIAEALKTMVNDMANDEAVVGMIGNYTAMLGDSAPSFEDIKTGLEKAADNLPSTVTAEYYSSQEQPGVTYITGEAAYEGKEGPAYTFKALMTDAGLKFVLTETESDVDFLVDVTNDAIRLEIKQGEEVDVVITFTKEGEDPEVYTFSLYLNSETPVFTLTVSVAEGGERTLPTEAGEKTVLAFESLMSGEDSEALDGLQQDLISNGLTPLLQLLGTETPEIMMLITSAMSGGSTTAVPAEEAAPAGE